MAGNVHDELAAKEVQDFADYELEPGQGEEGCAQMRGADDDAELREEERDEVLS